MISSRKSSQEPSKRFATLVHLPGARRDLPPRHDLVGFRGLDRYDRCALPHPKSPGGKRPGEDNAECAPCHCSLLSEIAHPGRCPHLGQSRASAAVPGRLGSLIWPDELANFKPDRGGRRQRPLPEGFASRKNASACAHSQRMICSRRKRQPQKSDQSPRKTPGDPRGALRMRIAARARSALPAPSERIWPAPKVLGGFAIGYKRMAPKIDP